MQDNAPLLHEYIVLHQLMAGLATTWLVKYRLLLLPFGLVLFGITLPSSGPGEVDMHGHLETLFPKIFDLNELRDCIYQLE